MKVRNGWVESRPPFPSPRSLAGVGFNRGENLADHLIQRAAASNPADYSDHITVAVDVDNVGAIARAP